MINQGIQTQEMIDTKTGTVRKTLTRVIHEVTLLVQMDGEIMIPTVGDKMEEVEEDQLVVVVVTNVVRRVILQENALLHLLRSSPIAVQVEEDTFPKKKMTSTNCSKTAFHPGSILIGKHSSILIFHYIR